jgi:hypothetical protein
MPELPPRRSLDDPVPDLNSLTEDLIIGLGSWKPTYAKVAMIAVDDDVAIALVDETGTALDWRWSIGRRKMAAGGRVHPLATVGWTTSR